MQNVETSKVDETDANYWLTLFKDLKKKCYSSGIFNEDETGISYQIAVLKCVYDFVRPNLSFEMKMKGFFYKCVLLF